jgi:hypothetical protein
VTLEGSIKALILEFPTRTLGVSSNKREFKVGLQATMPGLNRRLQNFDVIKTVEVGYQLELESIDFLKTVGQGTRNKITLNIKNRSLKSFGGGLVSPRQAVVRLSIPTNIGALSITGTWSNEVIRKVGMVLNPLHISPKQRLLAALLKLTQIIRWRQEKPFKSQ